MVYLDSVAAWNEPNYTSTLGPLSRSWLRQAEAEREEMIKIMFCKRVHNKRRKGSEDRGWRCTVCATIKPIGEIYV